jgi:hypothetical protein
MANSVRKATLRPSSTKRATERAKTLGVLKSFQLRWKLPVDISIESEPFAGLGDSGDLDTDLGDPLVDLGELARDHKTGVSFTTMRRNICPGQHSNGSALIKRGLIYSHRYGEINFTVPMFDQFIRRSL